MRGPFFIALEGLDGSGKSTLAPPLARRLDAMVLATPPAELRITRLAVDAAYAECPVAAQLFYASTVAWVSELAGAALRAGRSVVVDRYWLSTVVYSALRPGALDLAVLEPGLRPTDATVLLTLEEPKRQRRLAGRGMTAADRRCLDASRRLTDAYELAVARPFAGHIVRVDTGIASPEAATDAVVAALEAM